MSDAAPDDDLIARIAGGDTEALAQLHARHGPAVWSVARAFAASEAEIDDVVQDTFLAVLESAHTFVPGRPLKPWLFAIARNAGRRTHRRKRERQPLPAEPSRADPDEPPLIELGVAAGWGAPEQTLSREADAESLAWAIASLGPDDREVLILRDVEGWSGDATAEALGLGLAAMKSRLHRARLRLLAALRDQRDGSLIAHEQHVGGLRCAAVLARLGDYVDGEVEAEVRAQIDAHLRGCNVCERFGGRYAGMVHAARDRLGAAHVFDAATFERVRAALSHS